jgi:transcriptional regulator NrdR family protein
MKHRYTFPNKIEDSDDSIIKIEENNNSILELEIIRLIDKALKERLIELSSEDIKVIARELMPDLDEIISRKVKQHFYELGVYMAEKFK